MVLLYNEKTKKKQKKNEKKIPAYFKIDCIILKPICFSSSPVHCRKKT